MTGSKGEEKRESEGGGCRGVGISCYCYVFNVNRGEVVFVSILWYMNRSTL